MEQILIPTDFSKNALNAAKYGFDLATASRANVILFHAYEDPTTGVNVPFANLHYGRAEAEREAQLQMTKLVRLLTKAYPNIKMDSVIVPGLLPNNLSTYIKKHPISKVVMGSTGQNAISVAVIGSTTAAVIKQVPCDLVVVPPKAKFKGFEKVVLAMEFDKDQSIVAYEAAKFARKFQAEIILMHVQDFAIVDDAKRLKTIVSDIKRRLRYTKISSHIYKDLSVTDGIRTYLKKAKPDLLIMLTHARNFPRSLWDPSVTSAVANAVSVPLMVMHAGFVKPKRAPRQPSKTTQLN